MIGAWDTQSLFWFAQLAELAYTLQFGKFRRKSVCKFELIPASYIELACSAWTLLQEECGFCLAMCHSIEWCRVSLGRLVHQGTAIA
jgi:hypothetical protein